MFWQILMFLMPLAGLSLVYLAIYIILRTYRRWKNEGSNEND